MSRYAMSLSLTFHMQCLVLDQSTQEMCDKELRKPKPTLICTGSAFWTMHWQSLSLFLAQIGRPQCDKTRFTGTGSIYNVAVEDFFMIHQDQV